MGARFCAIGRRGQILKKRDVSGGAEKNLASGGGAGSVRASSLKAVA